MEQINVRALTKSLNHIELLDSWLVQCAILDGNYTYKQCLDKKTKELTHISIFGKRSDFIQRCKNKISNEEFKEKRLMPITIQGEISHGGNRKFILDIIENNQVVFKLNRQEHYKLKLPNLRPNIKNQLFKLQQLNEDEDYAYQIKLTDEYICISFDGVESTSRNEVELYNNNRYISFDRNPASIGVSVNEYDKENKYHKVLYTTEFSLQQIFDKIFNEKNLHSFDDKMKYFHNKLEFETIEIAKKISQIAKQFNCMYAFKEGLNFKSNVENKRNHKGNRICRNLWKRSLFIENLTKRLAIFGIKLYEVNPAYTSIVGNLKYDYTDPINASIEIGRRGFECKILKKDNFYPNLLVKQQWKQTVANVKNWKELSGKLKNSKLKYRVSLEEATELHPLNVFRLNGSKKSLINCYQFYQ
jgi:IS605 OrfB family transposase